MATIPSTEMNDTEQGKYSTGVRTAQEKMNALLFGTSETVTIHG